MMNSLTRELDIVVAHYNEDIDWLKPWADNLIIYHKWKETEPRFPVKNWVKLPNVWREAHTYLTHIVENYDNLADVTVFTQGRVCDQMESNLSISEYIQETKKYWFSCKKLSFTPTFLLDKKGRITIHGTPESEKIEQISLSHYYPLIFWAKKKLPIILSMFCCANFWVIRKNIHFRTKAFYKKILNIRLLSLYAWSTEPYCLEVLWYHIFNPHILHKGRYLKKHFVWLKEINWHIFFSTMKVKIRTEFLSFQQNFLLGNQKKY